MIETPRAALRADEIAEEADFFSFGTNDLTQMTFGFSRDDVEGRMMPAYLEQGLLKRNPFETIDQDGVGELVRIGAERGRATKPGLKLGVCGEHGGDPESIDLFYEAGLDYVSCSPFRVPIARLAAAQAVLGKAPATPAEPAGPWRPPRLAARPSDLRSRSHVTHLEWLLFLGFIVALLLVDLLVVPPERPRASARGGGRSRRWSGSRSAWPSALVVLARHGGQAAGEYFSGYLHREEPERRQRLRVGPDLHATSSCLALPAPGAVLGRLRRARPAGRSSSSPGSP